MRVEGDLPEVTVAVGEIAVIAAPKRLGTPLQNARTCGVRLRQHGIDLSLACDILRNGDAAIAIPQVAGVCILDLRLPVPQREHGPAGVEEAHLGLACPVGFHEAEALIEACGFS